MRLTRPTSCPLTCRRAEIEAEYAKRLAKLAKAALGKDETGATRQALDVVRAEIDTTSRVHSDLSTMIRKDLEGSLAEFQAKMAGARKSSSASIEKLYKNKQAQENYVNKSRERYEQDCIRINGYTAQSSLVQGRDLDKVTNKLDKAQSTVASNDKDYQNFVRALKDTTHRWNSEFKAYLDQCQDIEEERLDFIKSNLWNYANAISAVCVADDEGCERVRVALENCDTPSDISDFIRQRGTGPAIPDPPEYINYAKGQPPPARPSFRTANFQRVTTRVIQPPAPVQPFVPGTEANNTISNVSPASAAQNAPQPPGAPIQLPPKDTRNNGPPSGPGGGDVGAAIYPSAAAQPKPPADGPDPRNVDPQGPIDARADKRMSTKNFLARTPSSARRDSGVNGSSAAPASMRPSDPVAAATTAAASSPVATGSTADEDPIAKALANLRARPGGKSPTPGAVGAGTPSRASASYDPNYRTPSRQQQPNRAPSPVGGIARPSSPSAAFMQAPQRAASPLPVEEVVGQYGQSFPGERRALSRQNSVASGISHRSAQPVSPSKSSSAPQRAKSPGIGDGFAGVGARGRSPSPQPFGRPASRQQQHTRPPAATSSAAPQNGGHAPARSQTPLGISLDASGSVTHDQMAAEYMQRAGSIPPTQAASYQQLPPSQPYQQQQQQQQQPYQNTHQQRPSSVVYGHQPQQMSTASGYQTSQLSTAGSQFTITPHHYAGQAATPAPQHQPPAQYAAGPSPHVAQHHNYNPSTQQSISGHQDSSSSLGRASGYEHSYAHQGYGQQPPPNSQSFPTINTHQQQPSVQHARPQQPQSQHPSYAGQSAAYGHQAAPSHASQHSYTQQAGPTPSAETPASAYMHQYQQRQQQQQQPAAAQPQWSSQAPPSGAPGPHQAYTAATAAAPPPPSNTSTTPAPQPAGPNHAATPGPGTSPSPAPAPTGQYSDTTGKPILFYVKAMYDYSASSTEEFSFQLGDIIAVTGTDPDGWWTGELLDERRRERGRETFPSNFTTLLT